LEGQVPSDWRKELVIECEKPDGRMLHTGRYKYTAYASGAHPEELFDLQEDPGELRNLAEAPEHRAVLEDCRHRLAAWRRENGDT
jgi:choline-sulfatase